MSPEKVNKLLKNLDINTISVRFEKNLKFVRKCKFQFIFSFKLKFRIENWVDINKN